MHAPPRKGEEVPVGRDVEGANWGGQQLHEGKVGGKDERVLDAESFLEGGGGEGVVCRGDDAGGVGRDGGKDGRGGGGGDGGEDVVGGDVGDVAGVADVGDVGCVVFHGDEGLVLEVFADAGEGDLGGDVVF